MKNIQSILILLTMPVLLLSLSNCGGTKQQTEVMKLTQNPPFVIAEAFFQNWVAGVEEGGSGTNIHITFQQIEPTVEIRNLYFRDRILPLKKDTQISTKYTAYLNHETQRNIIMDADPVMESQNAPPSLFPFKLKDNEAVIEFWNVDAFNYFKIENLQQKEMLAYPKTNPNSHE